MGISKERRLLQMIHQNARINKECSECEHEGDFSVCGGCECDPKHKRWEWRFADLYKELRQQAEDAYADRPKRRRKQCRQKRSPKRSAVSVN